MGNAKQRNIEGEMLIALDNLANLALDKIKKTILAKLLSAIGLTAGFWATLVTKLFCVFWDRVILPALEQLIREGMLFVRRKDLEKKLKKYMEAMTDEEFDEAFDNLLRGSKLRIFPPNGTD